jgi:hypothetical protein
MQRMDPYPFQYRDVVNKEPIKNVFRFVIDSDDAQPGGTLNDSTYRINLPITTDTFAAKIWVDSWFFNPGVYKADGTTLATEFAKLANQVYSVSLDNFYLPNTYDSGTNSTCQELFTTCGQNCTSSADNAVPLNDFTAFRHGQLRVRVNESSVFLAQGGFAGLDFQYRKYKLVLYVAFEETSKLKVNVHQGKRAGELTVCFSQ